jgi:hypothetical protein
MDWMREYLKVRWRHIERTGKRQNKIDRTLCPQLVADDWQQTY